MLHEVLRISHNQYQPKQLQIRAGFSLPVQALFFLFYASDSIGVGYLPCVMPRPGLITFTS